MKEESEDGHLFSCGFKWTNWSGLILGDFERGFKESLEVECNSLWDHCERNLDGVLPCLGS